MSVVELQSGARCCPSIGYLCLWVWPAPLFKGALICVKVWDLESYRAPSLIGLLVKVVMMGALMTSSDFKKPQNLFFILPQNMQNKAKAIPS